MEAELMKMDSILEHLAVSEDGSIDEAISIDTRKERNTTAYKETMSQHINNIDTDKTRSKFNTTKWRTIYEVIDEANI